MRMATANNIAILVNIDEDVRVLREIQSSEGFQHRARSLLSLDTIILSRYGNSTGRENCKGMYVDPTLVYNYLRNSDHTTENVERGQTLIVRCGMHDRWKLSYLATTIYMWLDRTLTRIEGHF